jgi:hypothetical protein
MNLRIDSTLGFANLRSTPNTSVAPIDRLPVGHLVTTTGDQQGDWRPCRTTLDGNVLNGFVHASLLRGEINPEVDRLVECAGAELREFEYGTRPEMDQDSRTRIADYWIALNMAVQPISTAWSAAFMSFVVRQAALAKSFRFSQRHTTYLSDSKTAKINNDATRAYWAVRLGERRLQIGDLVGAFRTGGTCGSAQKTYDSLPGDFCSHCDVVVSIRNDTAFVVGGNVGDTVKLNKVPLTPAGNAAAGGKRIAVMARNF